MLVKNNAETGAWFLSLVLIFFWVLSLSSPLFAASPNIRVAYFGMQAGELESCG
ncbi:hypothetical protein [Desulforapulum autotrophicum]|nr:hypothetical protein [Desulforapulum autotrophicum]